MSVTNLVVRVEQDLIDKIDKKAVELEISRSLLVREILFLMFSTREEIATRVAKEKAVFAWIRAGQPEPCPVSEE
jgi:hypothetical protein